MSKNSYRPGVNQYANQEEARRKARGNPVGTVFVALSAPEGVFVRQLALGGDRERIRTLSAHHALDLLRRYLTHQMTEGE